MTIMKWGKKKWKINKKVIQSLEKLSYSMSYNVDDKKKDPVEITIPYAVYRELGVNVKKEVNNWKKYLGETHGLYIGKKRFGPKRMKLVSVDVSDILVAPKSTIHAASISITLREVK